MTTSSGILSAGMPLVCIQRTTAGAALPSVWTRSVDSGATYAAYALNTAVAHVAAAADTIRYRATFAATSKSIHTITLAGDLHDVPSNSPGKLYIDGNLVSTNFGSAAGAINTLDVYLDVGAHVIEFWHGTAETGNDSVTAATIIPKTTTYTEAYRNTVTGTYLLQNGSTYATLPTDVITCGACPREAGVVAACGDLSRSVITFGSNFLSNGDFLQSSGTGATSALVSGPTTGYAAANDIFAAGVGTWAFFTTNAGAVTGGNAVAAAVPALSGRSMAVNVGPNTALAILQWTNIYLEAGKSYALLADVAILNNPYACSVKVDGVVVAPLTAPAAVGVWQKTVTTFTYTGSTGYHTIGVFSNTAAAAGNDHCFDNFEFRQVASAAESELLTVVTGQRVVIDYILKTAGCNDDRRDLLLGDISKAVANIQQTATAVAPGAATIANVATVNLPSGVRTFSVTANAGKFDVSFDNGNTYPLLARTGSRTWGQTTGAPLVNSQNIRIRGNAAGADIDVIWEI